MRFSVLRTIGIVGLVLNIEPCGCKHIDLCLWWLMFRLDFGTCRFVELNEDDKQEPL